MSTKSLSPLPGYRVEVRLAGSGGQGIILAGLVLAEAVGVYDGREVAMVQSYGPEARGGASKAEVIISESPIDYPLCTRVDMLLALTQQASDAYCWDLKPDAWIIIDSDLVLHPPSSRAIALPFTAIAREKLHGAMAANIVALGAISEIAGLVSRRSLERALVARVPSGSEALNKKALSMGIKLARKDRERKKIAEPSEVSPEDM
ncbi:MAG: 2-oxoacid:acceptor oxidoreductase family protein [Deltaproteobacteria bacterium]